MSDKPELFEEWASDPPVLRLGEEAADLEAHELKLLRELEEAVRSKRPVGAMLIGLDRLRKLANKPPLKSR